MKKFLKIFLPIFLGIFLCWYAYNQFNEQQLKQIRETFLKVNYWYIALAVFLGFLSDISRAIRWELMLRPIGYTTSLLHRIMAVFIGYLINVTIPRSGEVSRALLVSNYDGVPFEKSFGTIISERVIDLLLLFFFTSLAFLLQFDIISTFLLSKIPFQKFLLLLGILGITFISLIYFIYTSKYSFFYKIRTFLNGIREGIFSILKIQQKTLFIAYTLFIWAMYFAMFYIPFLALPETASISLPNILTAFVIGSFAMSFTNAGFGSYPFFIAEILFLFGVNTPIGTAFGWLVWISQFAMTLLMGGLSFVCLPLIKRNKNN
nr:lysylphosphatidylglycerol synthase transmembrane domain-containing protein [uncultured Capnocytophaga sp.]